MAIGYLPQPSFLDRVEQRIQEGASNKTSKPATRRFRGPVKEGRVVGKPEKSLKSAAKVAAKVAAPIQALLQAKDALDLLDEDEREQVLADYVAMGDDNVLSRAFQGFINPVNTIAGAGMAASDVFDNYIDAPETAARADAMRERLARSRGNLRDAALSTLNLDEDQARQFIRDTKEAGKFGSYSKIEKPEQARALYEEIYGPVEDFDSESGPEGEAIDDYGLSDARQAERDLARSTRRSLRRADRRAARRARRQAPAPTLDELREAADPDMRDMMGTEADFVPAEPAEQEEPQVDVNELFEVTHGTSFDPNSSMDRRKMNQIKKKLEEMGGSLGKMTPNQFAIQIYRDFDYV